MTQLYASVPSHKALLNYAYEAAAQLQETYTDEEMRMKTVEINVAFLHYVYELLLAYALTYEDHECSCGYTEDEDEILEQREPTHIQIMN